MNNEHQNTPSPAYNQAVLESYTKIVKQTKALLATVKQEPLRQIMEMESKEQIVVGTILHELISPLLYLRLECYKGNIYGIHYGYAACELATEFYPLTSAFIRSVYKLTIAHDSIDIQDCVRTDWVITETAELFEYMLDRNKHHSFKVIKHKSEQQNGKKLQAA